MKRTNRISDFGFRISDSEEMHRRRTMGGRPYSAFRVPHSALAVGVTLVEVLISMGILVVGLLGVLAIFPVAGHYMQQGEVADRGAAIAQAAFADAVTRGLLDPKNWYAMVNKLDDRPELEADGIPVRFQRPLAAALAEDLVETSGTAPAERQTALARRFGSAFVIDPLAVANTPRANRWVYSFPTSLFEENEDEKPWLRVRPGWPDEWMPWVSNSAGEDTWPIRRVTFRQPTYGQANGFSALHGPLAEYLFTDRNDLAMELPGDADLPGTQRWDWEMADLNNDNIPDRPLRPLSRERKGDYSWLITVVPTTAAARDGLAQGGTGPYYDVSVVVFYKRVHANTPRATQTDALPAARLLDADERCVRARVVSTGLSGGEVLLESYPRYSSPAPPSPQEEFGRLKAGGWVMLAGPHPQSSDTQPMFVLNWYRVLSVSDEPAAGVLTDPLTERLVALRGPQWPWQPAPNLSVNGLLSNYLCVGIFPSAVAVHNRKIRLEGRSLWSIE